MIAMVFAITSISVIPLATGLRLALGTYLQITDLNIGLLVVLGITSMGVYGVALADGPRITSIRCSADCAPARR